MRMKQHLLNKLLLNGLIGLGILYVSFAARTEAAEKQVDKTITIVVMDPLSGPLACDCVQGYAQRKYEVLGAFLQETLRRPVKVVWSESLTTALKEHGGPAHLVIGKHSVVLHDAAKAGLPLKPIAQLTGKDGKVTQTGLIVVRKDDAAQSAADLNGYRIFFGPEDCDEKQAAPVAMLKNAGIALPAVIETSPACSTAAAQLMELPAAEKAAAVISSYAEPLLEGCGTIKKGDLRVIAESAPVPFITAFASQTMPAEDISDLQTALLDVELNAQLLVALESSEGFKQWIEPPAIKQAKTTAANSTKKK